MGKALLSFLSGLAIVGALLIVLHFSMSMGEAAIVAPPVRSAEPMAITTAMEMGPHMVMTYAQPKKPGDEERAAAIAAAAKTFAEKYVDLDKALADGFVVALPDQKVQSVHVMRGEKNRIPMGAKFDPATPQMLIYEPVDKTRKKFRLIGVMYMAPQDSTLSDLDARIPLSYVKWHAHTNSCTPPPTYKGQWAMTDGVYGYVGKTVTEDACKAVGGTFLARERWMVHVYPFHSDPKLIWHEGMTDDDRGMDM